jgi:hypothetical protein
MVARRLRKRLPLLSDIDRVFNDQVIAHIAKLGRLPANANLTKFGRSIRAAVRDYIERGQRPTRAEVQAQLSRMHERARDALKGEMGIGAVKAALLNLSPEAMALVKGPDDRVPDVADLSDPRKRDKALRLLSGLTVRGAKWKDGRKRPGGKQSAAKLVPDPLLSACAVRPEETDEFFLCNGLEIAYWKATGRLASRWPGETNRGPFVALVESVLDTLGIEGGKLVSADDLVRRYLRDCKARKRLPTQPCHTLSPRMPAKKTS